MFLTLVDDFSRFTWVHMLKHKSDCVQVMTAFLNHVETQFHTKVLTVRSDNAKEFTHGGMFTLFQSRGIFHQTSCAYTPQQNGVVERKHRHLLETARCLYFHSKIPEKYWNECILCATYLINRLPLQSINNDSPYFRLYKSQASLDHLKTFGCLCFVSTTDSHRHKFDPRALMCAFLGYTPTQKGYRVLHLTTGEVFVSRDVQFHESSFPFHNQSTISENNIFLPMFQTPAVDTTVEPSFTNMSEISSNAQLNSEIFPSSTSSPPLQNSSSPPLQNSSLLDMSDSVQPIIAPRRSTRCHQPPAYLQSYKCNFVMSSTASTHWCNLVTCSPAQSSICAISEPKSYK